MSALQEKSRLFTYTRVPTMVERYNADMVAVTKQMFPYYPDLEQIKEFYCALGMAISTWQHVEAALFLTFDRAVVPGLQGAAASAFHALQHTQSKLNATDAAVQFALLQEADHARREVLLREWQVIRRKVNNRLERRNHLAHFEVVTYYEEPRAEDKIRLIPMAFDFRYAAGIKKPIEYRISNINNIAGSFQRVSQRLLKFLKKIPQRNPPG